MPVIFIMLDGLRPDAITATQPPNLMRFIERSSHTMNAQSVDPSITLPCHTSIFHSVPPSRHGILDNNWHSLARPVTGLIEQLHAHEKRCAMFHNWDPLRDLCRPGHLYFNYFINTGYDLDGDVPTLEAFITHYDQIQPDFTFFYFASIDVAGHTFGWMSEKYLEQVLYVDELLGRLLAHLHPDTHIIIHADHGGHERTHGTTHPEDMTVPYMIAGPGIPQGQQLEGAVSLLDTAPTVARLLQIPPSPQWEGRALVE